MNKYKNILLWSSILLVVFQTSNIVYALEKENPIYNPINPTQEVQPLENKEHKKEEPSDVVKEEKTVKKKNRKINKIKKKKITHVEHDGGNERKYKPLILTDELFSINLESTHEDGLGSDDENENSPFYFELINELVGITIYGRKC